MFSNKKSVPWILQILYYFIVLIGSGCNNLSDCIPEWRAETGPLVRDLLNTSVTPEDELALTVVGDHGVIWLLCRPFEDIASHVSLDDIVDSRSTKWITDVMNQAVEHTIVFEISGGCVTYTERLPNGFAISEPAFIRSAGKMIYLRQVAGEGWIRVSPDSTD